MRLYNTLGREVTELRPRDEGKIGMYVCGATVQSAPHLGHGRSAVVFDVIRRYLEWLGFDVTYVRNVTDVDDKIIAAAIDEGVSTDTIVERAYAAFDEAHRRLGVKEPTVEPWATHHIDEMLELIGQLPTMPMPSTEMSTSRSVPIRSTAGSRGTTRTTSDPGRVSIPTTERGIRSTSHFGRRRSRVSLPGRRRGVTDVPGGTSSARLWHASTSVSDSTSTPAVTI